MSDIKLDNLQKKAANLPDGPGIYIMKDRDLNIIYVGKAKNLKNRVSQYFRYGYNHTEKVLSMIENIQNFEYIVTDTEYEALVLECNFIKKYSPKYNILLKDDKGYNYIKINNEIWPKITITNKKVRGSNCKYIGPFMSLLKARNALDEVVKIFKLPTCKRNFNKLSKPCLNYYINQCTAPCAGKISLNLYLNDIKNAYSFLKNGGIEEIKKLKIDMVNASNSLQFEKAAKIRDRIHCIESIENKQKIILNNGIDCDFIAFVYNDCQISMNILKFKEGNLYESENYISNLNDDINESKLELIESYYIMKNIAVNKIFIDSEIIGLDILKIWLSEESGCEVDIKIPNTRQELQIMKMCQKNSYEGLIRAQESTDRFKKVLLDLKNILELKDIPNYIEAYDISNIQNSQKVGGLVVFKNGKSWRQGYKKFKIKSVYTQNDYADMLEVIQRRFNEYLKKYNNNGFAIKPNLVLIDGGIGHTRKVKEYLGDIGLGDIPVFGMIKGDNHKTRAITNGIMDIDIKSIKNIFDFITNIQDEVHRFTIGYHRKRRTLEMRTSELEKIPGIGKKRSKILLKRFKSVERLSQSSLEELVTIPGITSRIAKSIVEYFENRL